MDGLLAVLRKFDYANVYGLTGPSCTETTCSWNSCGRGVRSIMKFHDVNIAMRNKGKE